MFSRFFIDRPILRPCCRFSSCSPACGDENLPIAQYPDIAPPVVTVQAVYPGASRR